MSLLSSSSGTCGRSPRIMTLITPSSAQQLPACVAALMCSYVQPLGPGADPFGSACSTSERMSSVTVTAAVVDAGTAGGGAVGCRARSVSTVASVGSAIGVAAKHLTARVMLPSVSWRWARAAAACAVFCWRLRRRVPARSSMSTSKPSSTRCKRVRARRPRPLPESVSTCDGSRRSAENARRTPSSPPRSLAAETSSRARLTVLPHCSLASNGTVRLGRGL